MHARPSVILVAACCIEIPSSCKAIQALDTAQATGLVQSSRKIHPVKTLAMAISVYAPNMG